MAVLKTTPRKKWKPAANHPWRLANDELFSRHRRRKKRNNNNNNNKKQDTP